VTHYLRWANPPQGGLMTIKQAAREAARELQREIEREMREKDERMVRRPIK
jgi:hypothetical protein